MEKAKKDKLCEVQRVISQRRWDRAEILITGNKYKYQTNTNTNTKQMRWDIDHWQLKGDEILITSNWKYKSRNKSQILELLCLWFAYSCHKWTENSLNGSELSLVLFQKLWGDNAWESLSLAALLLSTNCSTVQF